MVCGSIGYGGVNRIRQVYSLLQKRGFDVLDHIASKGMDYSDVKDFRQKKRMSHKIVEHDLLCVKEADVLVVLAEMPSYGTAIEMFVAKSSGKKVILFAEDPIPTPWPVEFSDFIVKNEQGLLRELEYVAR